MLWLVDDSSLMAGTNGTAKQIAYTSDVESKQDLSSLCGKLLPILERLELLNEVNTLLSLSYFPSVCILFVRVVCICLIVLQHQIFFVSSSHLTQLV